MNWDMSIGRVKQLGGRLMQFAGRRLASRKLVLDGETVEYAGRLQMRYGLLKHQAQWNDASMPMRSEPSLIRVTRSMGSAATKKNFSV